MSNKPLSDLDKQLLKGLLTNDVRTYLKKEEDEDSESSAYDISAREGLIEKKPNYSTNQV